MNREKIIVIDGISYHGDRPGSCRRCCFWKNRKTGCVLGKENCYYLAAPPAGGSPCDRCCYRPCIGFCMKAVLGDREVRKDA